MTPGVFFLKGYASVKPCRPLSVCVSDFFNLSKCSKINKYGEKS